MNLRIVSSPLSMDVILIHMDQSIKGTKVFGKHNQYEQPAAAYG